MLESGRGKNLPVLDSIERVVEGSHWVRFHPERLEAVVREWGTLESRQDSWQHPAHFFDGTEETLRWIFILDVLNHCFWPDRGEHAWTVSFEGESYSGYWGLAASLKRALMRGYRITDPEYLADLRKEDLKEIFSGMGEIPLFEERLANLREAGRNILALWQGDVVHLLEETRRRAVETVKTVAASFPSFQDEADYRGHRVFFWKRVQLLVADIAAAFQGRDWGRFDDMGALTAFADYKLPQVLRELGIISYHPDLGDQIDLMQNLHAGSEQEIEIRAMTLRAVEGLKEMSGSLGNRVTSARVDQYLWQLGQLDRFRKKPYHRCRTIFY